MPLRASPWALGCVCQAGGEPAALSPGTHQGPGPVRRVSGRTGWEPRSVSAQSAPSPRPLPPPAGYLPNSEHAVEAMLAAASIGAIWSATSPDFGVNVSRGPHGREGPWAHACLGCAARSPGPSVRPREPLGASGVHAGGAGGWDRVPGRLSTAGRGVPGREGSVGSRAGQAARLLPGDGADPPAGPVTLAAVTGGLGFTEVYRNVSGASGEPVGRKLGAVCGLGRGRGPGAAEGAPG